MAEEKSAPKKEKTAKPAAEGAPAAPAEKKARAPRGAAGEKAAPAAAPAADGAPAPAAEQKPVEMVHGVARQPTAEELLKEELGAIKVRKAKGSKNVTSGIANVLASFNNTIVSITDLKGAVIAWSTAGKCNFRVIATSPHKRGIGMVFQSYALFPFMSVLENVCYPLKIRGIAATDQKRRAEAALEMVKLAGYGDRRINQLSGG
ncbi:MAG: 30S ribosomal protein S11, partial [Opitutaceae bacterium]